MINLNFSFISISVSPYVFTSVSRDTKGGNMQRIGERGDFLRRFELSPFELPAMYQWPQTAARGIIRLVHIKTRMSVQQLEV